MLADRFNVNLTTEAKALHFALFCKSSNKLKSVYIVIVKNFRSLKPNFQFNNMAVSVKNEQTTSSFSKTFEITCLSILKLFSPVLWNLIHFFYILVLNLSSYLSNFKSWFVSIWYSTTPKLADLTQVKDFSKYPHHLALSFYRQPEYGTIDFKQVAKVISWAWIANVKVISLHDKEGVLKSNKKKLYQYVDSNLLKTYRSLIEIGAMGTDRKPTFKILHFNPDSLENLNNKPVDFTIAIYSNEDSKSCIVNAAKDIFEKCIYSKPTFSLPNDLAHKQIDIETLNTAINKIIGWPNDLGQNGITKVQPDPDLLMVFGNINSTMGFLPWHIRLTEIHWLPPVNNIQVTDFLRSLQKFSKCEQRVGK